MAGFSNLSYMRSAFDYDAMGNTKEQVVYDRNGNISQQYVYSYEYDARGNCTKRIENEKVVNARTDLRSSVLELVTAQYRTISYY